MIIMELKDYNEVQRLLKLHYRYRSDTDSCLNIIKKYFDKSVSICYTCPSEVNFLYGRLKQLMNQKDNPIKVIDDI